MLQLEFTYKEQHGLKSLEIEDSEICVVGIYEKGSENEIVRRYLDVVKKNIC